MSVKWFDPISERWHAMPEPKPSTVDIFDPGEHEIATTLRNIANDRIWRAVVASATSSNMSEEAPCE
jgi:hypothetical protein